MRRTVALDLTCLFLAPLSRTPRGIDRVELAYAEHFLRNSTAECVGVLPTPWGVRFYERDRAIRGIEIVKSLWREGVDASTDDILASTRAALCAPPEGVATIIGAARALSIFEKIKGFCQIIGGAGFSFGRSCRKHLPEKAIYLNVGQLTVFRSFFRWLSVRSDVPAVFMVHDAIPIEYPDHHVAAGVRLHHSIFRNVAEYATALIMPSEAAKESVLRHLRAYDQRDRPAHAELLPVPDAFLEPAEPDQNLRNQPYFVICGAIDAHKNHLTILRAWEILLERRGKDAPKLVIAGSCGVTSAPVFDFLRTSVSIQKHVVIASGLSTAGLRQLISASSGVLMPSIAEGFGLPIVEALAQGVPVIASDIPAHREAGSGGSVRYVDSMDEEKWVAAIEQFWLSPNPKLIYRPKTWSDYFGNIERFLSFI